MQSELKKYKRICWTLVVAVILLLISLITVSIWADKLDSDRRVLMQMIQML